LKRFCAKKIKAPDNSFHSHYLYITFIDSKSIRISSNILDTTSMPKPIKKKNPIGVAFGMLGASKGGKARAKKLSAERKSEIARKGSLARSEKLSAKRRSEISRQASLARTKKLSPKRRSEIARKAGLARWSKKT
jgi:general stress protein YciG